MQKLLQAKTIKIPCMRAGLCQYKEERVFVPQSTLEKLAKTAYGIPVIIDHQDDEALKAALARGNFDDVAVGRVADMHYDTETDLWMAHMVIDTQEALDLFAQGYGVSTSYEVTADSEGGTFNAVPFDRTIDDGKYLHLAIVENPRYEIAVKPVFYNSVDGDDRPCLTLKDEVRTIETVSNSQGEKPMFKLFRTKREEVKENSDDMMVEVDGKQVAMNELIEAYKNAKKNEEPEDEEKPENEAPEVLQKDEEKPNEVEIEIKPEDEDEDLDAQVNALLASVEEEEKKNAEDAEAKAKEEEEKKNAEEKEKAEEEAKKNRYNSLNNAADIVRMQNSSEPVSLFEKAEIGRKRYGSTK
jgi:hypothetical protein